MTNGVDYKIRKVGSKKILPIGDKILAVRKESRDKTEGGLILPDSSKIKLQEAHVLAVGQGRRLPNGTISPLFVKPGDDILIMEYGPADVEVDGTKYLIVLEDQVLAILK